MKRTLSKSQAQEEINAFFKKESFAPEQAKKIKRLAMKYKIRLGKLRKNFCKKCSAKLNGKTRITKTHKTIECKSCCFKNKFKIK